MNAIARRDFLFGAFSAPRNTPETGREKPAVVSREALLAIGRIADFPVGREVPFTSGSIIVESLPEGLRARSTENDRTYFEIKAGAIGELMVNRAEKWPADRIFSILTGGPASLETHWEEQA